MRLVYRILVAYRCLGVRVVAFCLLLMALCASCGGSSAPEGQEGPGSEAPPPQVALIGKGHQAPRIPERPEPVVEADLPTGILVMIDNYEPARPQMGVDKADVVFEIIAEGGITRYMALFYTEAAPVIGPVRSARYYFVQLAKGMDLPFARVGGADDAQIMIGSLRIKDIDEITNSQRYFWQDPARRRPHSTYTSTDMLVEAAANKRYEFKAPDLPPVATSFSGAALDGGQLTVTYPAGGSGYAVQWIWDASLGDGGQYLRHINGKAQYTADGAPMVADTVFVVAAPSRSRTIDGVVTSAVDIVGSGDALCIVDNKIIRGTWVKESAERPLIVSDTSRDLMTRKQGKLWIQVVDSLENVHFGQ